MKTPVAAAAIASVAAIAMACGTAGNSGDYLDVGGGDDGGAPQFTGGDAAAASGFDAYIERDQVAVKFVNLGCSGSCATVQAVPVGGTEPYTFAWDNGSTSATRRICPAIDTSYWVKVTDTGLTGEFVEPAQTVQVPLTADVLACTDGSAGGSGACVPGTYTGTWTGTGIVDGSTGDAASYVGGQAPITDPVTFAFVDSDSGTELVPSGPLILTWDIAATWTAHLTGGLDCATGIFHANDPMATTTVAGAAAGNCDMTLNGVYDSATATIAGQWTSDCSSLDWGGTWTVTLMP